MKKSIFILFILISAASFGQEKEELLEEIAEACSTLTTQETNNVVFKDGKSFTGKCISKNAKGSLQVEKNYSNGLLAGYNKVFFENGKLKESTYYLNNLKNGKYFLYSEEGKVISEGNYKNNLKDGYWKTFGKSASVKKYTLGVEKKVEN